jgi:signal peptidase I
MQLNHAFSGRPDGTHPGAAFYRFVRGWILPAVLVAAIVTPLRSALADWYQVPSGSMRPTILEGDRILVNNLAFGLRVPFTTRWITHWSTPKRGDIVTCASPVDGIRLVKRIIGLPGDRISMQNDHLFLNGRPLQYLVVDAHARLLIRGTRGTEGILATEALPEHSHPVAITPALPSRRSFPELVVPEGCYFMMGDNRDDSYDSRYFGFVRADKVYGRASHVVVSFDPQHYYLPRAGRWMKPLV